jgi:hypothetical protein
MAEQVQSAGRSAHVAFSAQCALPGHWVYSVRQRCSIGGYPAGRNHTHVIFAHIIDGVVQKHEVSATLGLKNRFHFERRLRQARIDSIILLGWIRARICDVSAICALLHLDFLFPPNNDKLQCFGGIKARKNERNFIEGKQTTGTIKSPS